MDAFLTFANIHTPKFIFVAATNPYLCQKPFAGYGFHSEIRAYEWAQE